MPSQQSPAYRRTLRIGVLLLAIRLVAIASIVILSSLRMISDDALDPLIMFACPEAIILEMYVRHWAGILGALTLMSFLAAWLRVIFVPAGGSDPRNEP
jgi:hypothetical protein